MKPIKFKESNKVFTKPKSMTDKQCGSLPVYQDDEKIISCWTMSWKELLVFFFTGKIWLWNISQTQAPIVLDTKFPFKK